MEWQAPDKVATHASRSCLPGLRWCCGVQTLRSGHETDVEAVRAEAQVAQAAAEEERAAVADARAAAAAAVEREGVQRDARDAAEGRVAALEAELEAMRSEVSLEPSIASP